MTALLLFPCNGNAIEALDCVGSAFEPIGFLDDSPDKQGREVFGYLVHPRAALDTFPHARVLAVPGSADTFRTRRAAIESLGIGAARFATVIHPSASVSPRASIGTNVLIMAGVVVTSNAVIGNHVCLLPNTVVHHDAVIEDATLVGSNVTIAGHVTIEAGCYIGSGTNVIHGARIGAGTLVGLGSNVVGSFPPAVRIAGNPARVLEASPQSESPCR